jgi:hypothetical protein
MTDGVRRAAGLGLGFLAARQIYRLVAHGALTIDTGIGRTVQPLGPVRFVISARRDVVFDVVAEPYLGRTPRALQDKLEVWERGTDMVLTADFTPVKCGVTTTVETVRLQRRLTRRPRPKMGLPGDRGGFIRKEAKR